MEIKIEACTPIWTGGVESGKCDRIHETSILGSLRWWMEVLVRGMGGYVSDPTSENRSGFDLDKYKKSKAVDKRQRLHDAGLCDVSQIFGATGWKRRFRLDLIEDGTYHDNSVSPKIELPKYEYEYKDKDGNTKRKTGTPKWHFPEKSDDKPKSGVFTLKIESLDPSFNPEVICGLVQFIADWSALGARSQMGFGVIKVLGDRINTQPLYNWLISIAGNKLYLDMPSLQNIFLAQIQLKNSNSLLKEIDTFKLKYELRGLFRTEKKTMLNNSQDKGLVLKKDRKDRKDKNIHDGDGGKKLRHFIMGTAKDGRMAAKIKISRPYNNENRDKLIRVWGWIPEEPDLNGWNKEKVIDIIYQHIKVKYDLCWREMNSVRDTTTENENDIKLFLNSLLQLQEYSHAK